jgi:hypothetical protein
MNNNSDIGKEKITISARGTEIFIWMIGKNRSKNKRLAITNIRAPKATIAKNILSQDIVENRFPNKLKFLDFEIKL